MSGVGGRYQWSADAPFRQPPLTGSSPSRVQSRGECGRVAVGMVRHSVPLMPPPGRSSPLPEVLRPLCRDGWLVGEVTTEVLMGALLDRHGAPRGRGVEHARSNRRVEAAVVLEERWPSNSPPVSRIVLMCARLNASKVRPVMDAAVGGTASDRSRRGERSAAGCACEPRVGGREIVGSKTRRQEREREHEHCSQSTLGRASPWPLTSS